MKTQTYQDALEALLSQSVVLPPELLTEIEKSCMHACNIRLQKK
jgi:hypothetical protein